MSMARVTTFIDRRFREARKEYKEHNLVDIPGFLKRNDALRKELLEAAQKIEEKQLQFWLREFRLLKADADYALAQHIVFRIRQLQRDLPSRLRLRSMGTLDRKLRAHALRHARRLWTALISSAASDTGEVWSGHLTELRVFLRHHHLTLADAGATEEEIIRLRKLNRQTNRLRGEIPKRVRKPETED